MAMQSQLSPQIERSPRQSAGRAHIVQADGMPQLSIVTVYPRGRLVGISITGRARVQEPLRDPRCSVLVSHVDWWFGPSLCSGQGRARPTPGQRRPRGAAVWLAAHL